jgi:hypothetical protein
MIYCACSLSKVNEQSHAKKIFLRSLRNLIEANELGFLGTWSLLCQLPRMVVTQTNSAAAKTRKVSINFRSVTIFKRKRSLKSRYAMNPNLVSRWWVSPRRVKPPWFALSHANLPRCDRLDNSESGKQNTHEQITQYIKFRSCNGQLKKLPHSSFICTKSN